MYMEVKTSYLPFRAVVRFSGREMSSTWVEAIAIFRAIEEHIFEVKVNCGGENFGK